MSRPQEPRTAGRWGLAVAFCALVALTGVAVTQRGVFLSRDWLFAWILVLLLVLLRGSLRRWLRAVAFDWLPLMAVLLFYDLSNGVRELVGIAPHLRPQLDADRVLGAGEVPTLLLQHALYTPGRPHWYDYATFAVYLSHFFVTLAVALALWRFAHRRFRLFRVQVVALATAGFCTYVLFPAIPPWMAALEGGLAPVRRTIGEMWQHVGLQPAAALLETREEFYNEVAAIPSLHAAYPVLLLLFFWGAGRWARVGLGAYALAMAFTLVYSGEHYIVDVVVGWVYAGGCFTAVSLLERVLARPRRQRGYEAGPRPVRAA